VFVFTSMPLPPSAVRTQGADSNDTNLAGEPTDQAIGRWRGGVTAKVRAFTDGVVRLVSLLLPVGQARDNPVMEPLLETYRSQQDAKHAFTFLADKAYSHPSTMARLRVRGKARGYYE